MLEATLQGELLRERVLSGPGARFEVQGTVSWSRKEASHVQVSLQTCLLGREPTNGAAVHAYLATQHGPQYR